MLILHLHLSQKRDQRGHQRVFLICSILKQWSEWSSLSVSLLCLNVVISELKICWFCQLWLWPVIKELKDVFQPILHFKGLIRELSEEFWSELSQRGDHRAQTLAFYFLSLTTVIKELKHWVSIYPDKKKWSLSSSRNWFEQLFF